MRKTTIILFLIIQISLLFVFQNIHSLFKEIENRNSPSISNPYLFMEDIKRIAKFFSGLSIVTGILMAGTGFYLIYLFRKSKEKIEPDEIPPLHDYLLELKGSETQLKTLLEKQKENVIEKEELNKSIINNINSAVIFLNNTGRIHIFNSVAEQVFSQSYANARNSLPGKILSEFPEIVEFVNENEEKKASKEIFSKEKIFYADIIPIENVGRLLLVKDITEEKKREEIEQRNSNFIMLGEMAAFLAHEVRNSLGVIFGYTKTIQTEKEKTEKITKEINFLTAMMESFLNFSKPVKIDLKKEIDMADTIKKIAAELNVEVHLNRDKERFESDPALIRSIFSNLLHNSVEAGANRIDVTFNTENEKRIEIILNDNGGGIDEKIRENIWYPFFTTKDKGTGMGLAIIRKIINSLNGEISLIESTPQGTIFKIVFYA